ncbi:hypothetical protein NUW54_g9790 [Trametes sanguinea]|uniref:Uncharacterized protein n=1 Tax=Trametes sanguinea TaxID=158606 RepID=A0ACC1P3G5_9APHY|nr:hypothetical protein NUW54_g9790 [Trametes sanguinea]
MSVEVAPFRIPIEVVEHMLDQLRGDSKTLVICCRVCKEWYSRARYNLYSVVDLHSDNSAKFFATAAIQPEIATFMREFTLYGLWKKPLAPPDVLRTTHLRTLRLYFIDTNNCWLPTVMHHARQSITELSLQHCFVPEIPALMRFLGQLPHLKHFAASEMLIKTRPDEVVHQTAGFPSLRSLCLAGFGALPLRLIRAFLAAQGLNNLTVLQIQLSTGELPEFNKPLRRVAKTLLDLDLTVEPDDTELVNALIMDRHMDISALTARVRESHVAHPQRPPLPHEAQLLYAHAPLLGPARPQHAPLGERAADEVRRPRGGRGAQDLRNIDWCAVAV